MMSIVSKKLTRAALRVSAPCMLAWVAAGAAIAADTPTPTPASAPAPNARPKTLFNSGDPTLKLTPPLRGSRPAPPGSAPPNPDPRNFEGVWWLEGYEYMLGPEGVYLRR